MSDLTHESVLGRLTTARLGRSLVLKASTGSTNDDARRAASEGAVDGHVIVADSQTQGRGSRGRSWLSPAGTDLYLSVVAHLPLPPASLPPLTLAVGLAAAETADALLPEAQKAEVKWPNDVWLARKKLVGVLVEGASLGEQLEPLVIGIGFNVNRRTFPDELAVPATSLACALGRDVARAEVLATLLNRLEVWLDRFVQEGPERVVSTLNERLALRGERALCGELLGTVEHVASSGALVLRTELGRRECLSGTLRPCGATGQAPA